MQDIQNKRWGIGDRSIMFNPSSGRCAHARIEMSIQRLSVPTGTSQLVQFLNQLHSLSPPRPKAQNFFELNRQTLFACPQIQSPDPVFLSPVEEETLEDKVAGGLV